jgi:hypothetical protein
MRPSLFLGSGALVALVWTSPARAQDRQPEWRLEGLRAGFCIQLLLDPASDALRDLPSGFRLVPASAAKDLHASLRDVIAGQAEFASWAPSELCLQAVDTIRMGDYMARGKRERPLLFGFWTVRASTPAGDAQDVVLNLYTSSGRLKRAAHELGQEVDEGRVRVGKVPVVDENGVPSPDDRFEVKVGKTVITWDGRLASDTSRPKEPVTMSWRSPSGRGGGANGQLTLTPVYLRSMVGALKVDGKDDFAKALKASPTRFAGPAYQGGSGVVQLTK